MADLYFNPFQAIDINVPAEFHSECIRYCSKGNTNLDQSPFPRMIDFWFLCVCIAARLDLEPADINRIKARKLVKMIGGTIFSSDRWRVDLLMLIAIEKTGNVNIISTPRKIMELADGLAVAGLPKVLEMLRNGNEEPIMSLSGSIDSLLKKEKAA